MAYQTAGLIKMSVFTQFCQRNVQGRLIIRQPDITTINHNAELHGLLMEGLNAFHCLGAQRSTVQIVEHRQFFLTLIKPLRNAFLLIGVYINP